jgi:hypothetical protein
MAYGVMSINGGLDKVNLVPASENFYEVRNGLTAQCDAFLFTDFLQTTFSATSPSNSWYALTALGGAFTVNSTADFATFGIDKCMGVLRLTTGTTNNATAYAAISTANGLIAGIPTPSGNYITRYECEANVEFDATIFNNSGTPRHGTLRFGYMSGVATTAPVDGVYFEFFVDTTTQDTTWKVVFRKDASQERIDTGVTITASNQYRLFLSIDKNSSGTYTTTYKIKNETSGVETTGTAAPSNAAVYYPAATTDYMGCSFVHAKQGTATTNATLMYLDYLAARIRLPLQRSMYILG